MSASISTDPVATPAAPDDAAPGGRLEGWLQGIDPIWVSVALFILALAVYLGSNPARPDFYDHFVWQADAFLQGRVEIAYPVSEGLHRNDYFQDVLPVSDDRAQVPFPPLPAIILLPFVAIWGLGTNGAAVAAVLGALNVVLCWIMLLGVTPRRSAALLGTLFYGFGTVAWYAAMLGTTWFLAHVVASTFLFIAIAIAVRADGRHRAIGRGFAAGLAFGAAATARLTTIFAAPFFVFVGGGGSWARRAVSAGAGALIPVLLLLGYNLVTTGAVFHPAYDHLYEVEYQPRPELVNPDWAIEDPRYIPQNVGIMLGQLPLSPLLDEPACVLEQVGPRSILDRDCPLLQPDPLGMSILLVSPAYLLMIPVLLRSWRYRLVAGAALAVLSVALVDLMHFSQGWVQFGYRFSNDFAPFATILVALGIARLGIGPISLGLVAVSIAVNAWGVYWGVTLGW
ncbi:MAG: hypothetical protein U9O18_09495 [Chloroflexota bacterium]|nr:hypothetical protein [Chloroflexota bacterium]